MATKSNPIQDRHLSLSSKGLIAYMLTQPTKTGWSMNELFQCSPDSPGDTKSAVRELLKKGYIEPNTLRPMQITTSATQDILAPALQKYEQALAAYQPGAGSPSKYEQAKIELANVVLSLCGIDRAKEDQCQS